MPFTLAIIFILLYLTFRDFGEAALIMGTLPFALVGGLWLLYPGLQPVDRIGVGIHRVGRRSGRVRRDDGHLPRQGDPQTSQRAAIQYGSRPDRCNRGRSRSTCPTQGDDGGGDRGGTVADHVWQRYRIGGDARIAAPMVGGMITAPMLSMLVLPAVYLLLHRRALAKAAAQQEAAIC